MRAFLAVAVLAASCPARSHKRTDWERLKNRILEGAVPTSDDVEFMLDTIEFPVVDPRLTGRRHRYIYAVGLKLPGNVGNLLTRTDCDTGETIANGFANRFGAVVVGEALVVPRLGVPDDYVVMVVVHDAAGDAQLVASPAL